MRLWNGSIVRWIAICLLCLSLNSCDYTGDTTAVTTNVDTIVSSGGTTTTARAVSTSGTSTANTLYFFDTFIDDYPFRTFEHIGYADGGGVIVLNPSDAYVQYTLPLQQNLFVQIDVANFQPTNAEKHVLLQLTDSMDAWIGDNHVWMDSSLIEVRQRDTDLRFRVGGSGDPEFKTEYVFDGLQYGAAYTIGLSVTPTTAILYVNGMAAANFPAVTFAPKGHLYLFVGGGVLNESCSNLLIQSVAVFF